MSIGYSPKLPLQYDSVDGYYKLNKTFGEVVKQNVKMVILTAPGERIMDPNFGVCIRNFLFDVEPVAINNLRTKIQSQLKKYVPFVKVIDIKLLPLKDIPGEPAPTNSMGVQLIYIIPDLGLSETLTITLKANS